MPVPAAVEADGWADVVATVGDAEADGAAEAEAAAVAMRRPRGGDDAAEAVVD